MKRLNARRLIPMVAATFLLAQRADAAKITSIDFKGTSDPAVIEVVSDGPVTFQKQDNSSDNQVVLEIQGATISKSVARKIDTSSFQGNVSLISPYQVEGQAETVRIVVQMRGPGSSDVAQDGNVIRMNVPFGEGAPVASADTVEPPPMQDGPPEADSALPPPPDAGGAPADALAGGGASGAPDATMPPKPRDRLDEFMISQKTRQFTGRPITLKVRDVDATDVFRLIGEASGFNIVVGSDVTGKITLSLTDVPWDQALDVVLHTLHLGAERNNNILRVVTLESLTREKQEELAAKQASAATAARVTRVFPISFANLVDLQRILIQFSSNPQAAQAGATVPGTPGAAPAPMVGGLGGPQGSNQTSNATAVVQADNRTNSLVVRDLPENIERMKKLIEVLDTQTPQVLIEAKIIQAQESFGKALSGSLGFGGNNSAISFFGSFAGANPLDALIGGVITGSGVSGTSIGGGSFGASPNVSFIPGFQRLNAILNIGENESQAKVVSSPKTVVLNKQVANIVQGTPVLIQTTAPGGLAGTPQQITQVVSANLSLNVTPTVTNEGSVLLQLSISNDTPQDMGNQRMGISNKNMTTSVLAESGSTLVIGGIYTFASGHSSSGFPILRKIPIIGALFGTETEDSNRSELFIFITPRILNPKEAGLS